MGKRESIIVIGAGVSGLSCASELQRCGHDVVVLEGRSRIGGRVWTDDRIGFPVDLGASWVMAHEQNPLTPVAKAAGAELLPTDWETLVAYSQGRPIAKDDLYEIVEGYEELIAEIRTGARSLTTDLSLAAAIARALSGRRLSAEERLGCELASAMLAVDTAADLDEIGVIGQEMDRVAFGHAAMVRGGYGQVPRYLARGLAIRTEHRVSRIEHGPGGVTVTTNQGRFEAARCVVSLPLGVLQAGTVVFAPGLPEAACAALGRLRMGTLDKVVLALPRRVIPDGAAFVARAGAEPMRFPLFADLEPLVGRPALCGFVAGKLARALEKKADDELIGEAMRSLREALGVQVPEPTAAMVVRWSADPFAGGSYSFVPVGGRESDRDLLAAPIGDRVYFCGEATQRNLSGTVHGAYVSGLRAAAQLTGGPAPVFLSQSPTSRSRLRSPLGRRAR